MKSKAQVQFSVVRWGPLKYTVKLWQALKYAYQATQRKGFWLDGKLHKLKPGETITVFRLNTLPGQNEVVQTFTVK